MKKFSPRLFQLPARMRWSYFQNVCDHFYQDRNLFKLLKFFFKTESDMKILLVIKESLDGIINEIVNKQSLIQGNLSKWKMVFLRCFIQLARPEIVVESGVAHGSSSAVILDALQSNRQGRLYSIDLPCVTSQDGELPAWAKKCPQGMLTTVPSLDQVGWLVPNALRERWELFLENSLVELPRLTKSLSHIDIFFHDSLHTYEHMSREFEIVWPHIKGGGFLLTDDIFIGGHALIYDFAERSHAKFKNYLQIGIIHKP